MKGIDTLKILFSLVVVWIHTGVGSLGGLTPWAVPFFFLVSGFFLFGKLFKESDRTGRCERIRNWWRKTLRLYLLWTIIFLPFAIWGFKLDQTPLLKSTAIYIRNILFVGENYLSWPLWYLLGLLWSGAIIGLCNRLRLPFWCLCLLAVILYFGEQFLIQSKVAAYYYTLFKTTRNGIFIGFPFMILGGFIRRILPQMNAWTPGSWQQKTALYFRFLSIHIYLSHMLWAGLMFLIWGAERGIKLWAITCVCSILTGILIRPYDRVVTFLYGRNYRPL